MDTKDAIENYRATIHMETMRLKKGASNWQLVVPSDAALLFPFSPGGFQNFVLENLRHTNLITHNHLRNVYLPSSRNCGHAQVSILEAHVVTSDLRTQ